MNDKDLLRQPAENHLWKQAVIGLGDGLIIAFAATTAYAVLHNDSMTVAKFAGAISMAVAVIMGIGGYLSAKFRMETLASKSEEEEERQKQAETKKTVELFKKLDIPENMQQQAADEIEKDSREWKNFLQKNQQPFEIPDSRTLPVTGLIIGISFMAGAFFAIFPFFLKDFSREALQLSAMINIPALLLTGFLKSKVNGEPVWWGTIRLFLLGIGAATAAYFVAGLFAK